MEDSMKLVCCLLLAATLPFGRAFEEAPKQKNVKTTLVYEQELPNAPGQDPPGLRPRHQRQATDDATRKLRPAERHRAAAVSV
jgi:hypothetical protein